MTIKFREARYLNLATFRKNGRIVETPVWFAEVEEVFYVFSAGNAGKVKRLKNSTHARVAPCDVRGQLLGPWRDAKAVIVHDPSETKRAHSALRKKYGWQMWLADLISGLLKRRRNRAYIAITV